MKLGDLFALLKATYAGPIGSEFMPLFALGLNHRTAPIDVREAVAFTPEAQRAVLQPLREESGAEEVVLVSTCNRSEIYLRGANDSTLARAAGWLHQHAPARVADLDAHLYRHHEDAVARHAMKNADIAMYRVKGRGRAGFGVFAPGAATPCDTPG